MNRTRQGVRDLNGPRMTGAGYNGRNSASCPHHRAPDLVAKHVVTKAVVVGPAGRVDTKHMVCCAGCGDELYENA